MRIKPPETTFFRLAYFPNTAVAPGLDAQFEIEFQALVEKDYHDKLVIYSGDETIEAPLHAYTPAPNIEFDTFCEAVDEYFSRVEQVSGPVHWLP